MVLTIISVDDSVVHKDMNIIFHLRPTNNLYNTDTEGPNKINTGSHQQTILHCKKTRMFLAVVKENKLQFCGYQYKISYIINTVNPHKRIPTSSPYSNTYSHPETRLAYQLKAWTITHC